MTVITYYITFLYCDIHHHIFFILSFTSSEEKKNQLSFIFLPTPKSYKLVHKKKTSKLRKECREKILSAAVKNRGVDSGDIICNHPSVKSLLEQTKNDSLGHE